MLCRLDVGKEQLKQRLDAMVLDGALDLVNGAYQIGSSRGRMRTPGDARGSNGVVPEARRGAPTPARHATPKLTAGSVDPRAISDAVIKLLDNYPGVALQRMHTMLTTSFGYSVTAAELQDQVLQPLLSSGRIVLEGGQYKKGSALASSKSSSPDPRAATPGAARPDAEAGGSSFETPLLALLSNYPSMTLVSWHCCRDVTAPRSTPHSFSFQPLDARTDWRP